MTTVNIRRQGGAAIMTIPADVMKSLGLDVGATLDGAVVDGALTARARTSAKRKRYTLDALLVGATPKVIRKLSRRRPGRGMAIRSAVRSDGSRRTAAPGDVTWFDPNPVAGREMRDRPRFVVITPRQINALGVAMTVAVTTGAMAGRATGLTVAIAGHDTTGVAVCNQLRSFDLEARLRAGSARYVETLDPVTTNEIISRVLSVIDPDAG